eukprot:1160729-Pelagomonas_calceolata.AAC.11
MEEQNQGCQQLPKGVAAAHGWAARVLSGARMIHCCLCKLQKAFGSLLPAEVLLPAESLLKTIFESLMPMSHSCLCGVL